VLRFRAERREDAVVIHCIGAFIIPNFLRLDEIIREVKTATAKKIVLNLTHVDRIDSVGVGTLSMILKHAMASGVTLLLVSNEYVRTTLAASGLDRVFNFSPSVDDALRSQDR
jgi:anti-anti-sigma factor